ncbi:hypothetical protein L3556_04880 [Candidatus Synechococcus calcipolaris G9]|uniref:DUF948 domain-containing protein n=1 Tax=Candidatus Synechococcus calcipolaris G9 TaxID=1497997 RepID=A0ABT6EX18_9SYNE|nr:hypothetical protein [Candidatus Synechococcus calcipolaris]MDG2990272.1 hypothetical protein [Candidatus Synechococcus calcipolaris G9]
MAEPIFWLALSLLLVAICLAAVLIAALPAFMELARAARSAEKLFDTLGRELPPTLEAIRLTGLEISDLTDDINDGVQSATQVVRQVDKGISSAKKQVEEAKVTTRSVMAGVKAAWKTWNRPTQHPAQLNHRSNRSLAFTPEPDPLSPALNQDREPALGEQSADSPIPGAQESNSNSLNKGE